MLTTIALSPSAATPTLAARNQQPEPPAVPDQLIVRFRPRASPAEIAGVYRSHALRELDDLSWHRAPGTPIEKLVATPAGRARALIAALQRHPLVELAEPNYVLQTDLTPNDPRFGQLWGLNNTGQVVGGVAGTADADIDAPEAWNLTTGSASVIVGVIDTGVNVTHEDLAANMWANPGEIPGNGIDDDGNGYIDDIRGINAILNTGNPADDNGHGTHVAGTLGAVGNNGVGVVGVNWTVRIAACKFLDAGGSGTTADAIKCFKYFNDLKRVRGQNVLITNNSWGGGGSSQTLKDAMAGLDQPGMAPILHAAAAGNFSANNDATPQFPASFDLDNLIAVAATDQTDRYASFTNFGATSVDVAAPGVNVLSTVPTGTCQLCDPSGYRLLNGTSMATPHVAGAAALLWAKSPTLTFSQVKARLMFNADPLAAQTQTTVTNARLNVFRALSVNDALAPSAVTSLAVSTTGLSKVTLTWTATGDDGATGTASLYEVRYATMPISEANWAAATRASGAPKPKPAGSAETMTVSGLAPGVTYFFALKVLDDAGNQSALSNVAQGSTGAGSVVFQDSMENGVNGWTDPGAGTGSLWHQTTHRANSPTNAWYFGIEGQFNVNTGIGGEVGTLTSPGFNLTGATEAILVFHEWVEVGPGMTLRVLIDSDQRSFGEPVFASSSSGGAWVRRIVDLNPFVGETNVQLWFQFTNCGSFAPCDQNFEGWYVDDVEVRVLQGAPAPTPTATPTPIPAPDTVAIQKAEYTVAKQELRVEATSTSTTATLQVFVTATNQLIGTLTNNGGGKYSGQFTWPVNPQNITVRSNKGGSAAKAVTAK